MDGEWQLTTGKPHHKANKFALIALLRSYPITAFAPTTRSPSSVGFAAPNSNSTWLFPGVYQL